MKRLCFILAHLKFFNHIIVENRIIGKYKGTTDGPLVVITAGMHGNEPAGVKALDLLFKMLEVEPVTNPEFTYKGEIIGLVGNLKAYNKGVRYISKDINRCWSSEHIHFLKTQNNSELQDEDLEIKDMLDIIGTELATTKSKKLYLLDLHTTSSEGIFCISTNEAESIRIAYEIHAPVILGLLYGISGTTLHYFQEENTGLPTTATAFEGGHHDDPLSVNRCIAATINFMRSIGVIEAHDVSYKHDEILKNLSETLPKIVEVFYRYQVDENDKWEMKPGYQNFDKIQKGTLLAIYKDEPVYAPFDGILLMPLYQKQGNDGFFIAREHQVSDYK